MTVEAAPVLLLEPLSFVKNTIVFILWSKDLLGIGIFLQGSGSGKKTELPPPWDRG